ncbi:heat-inducible transcription repressor HrcA [PVC group bacterium (ex Bugula neritina AB1)]|nr:heat-inducible transcription repressor HrcA [PVC group bacterium (ex Bugula neritina AB1)]
MDVVDFLTQRERDILHLIVEVYTVTAEPVASRVLVQTFDIGLSSATIRNVMSSLEQKGYIRQIYTSSGRVPTDRGYYLYVQQLMPSKNRSRKQGVYLKRAFHSNKRSGESFVQNVAHVLAKLTEFTAIISLPRGHQENIDKVKIIRLDVKRVMLILLFKNGMIRQKIVRLIFPETDVALEILAELLMARLKGQKVDPRHEFVRSGLLDEMCALDVFCASEELIIEGRENLMKHPEFYQYSTLSDFIRKLDDPEDLLTILSDSLERDKVNIYIGKKDLGFEDCSIVLANYNLRERPSGSIGVIGPKRMRYEYVIPIVENVADFVTDVLKNSDLYSDI